MRKEKVGVEGTESSGRWGEMRALVRVEREWVMLSMLWWKWNHKQSWKRSYSVILIQIVSVSTTMYSGSSDGESHDAPQNQRKIPPASSMLWVRNLRRFIGSGAGLGSEALMGPSLFFAPLFHLFFLPNPNHTSFPLSQSLKLREFCSTFLRKSRRKPPKLLQFPLSTRRNLKMDQSVIEFRDWQSIAF